MSACHSRLKLMLKPVEAKVYYSTHRRNSLEKRYYQSLHVVLVLAYKDL
jgi:hypothetical protein